MTSPSAGKPRRPYRARPCSRSRIPSRSCGSTATAPCSFSNPAAGTVLAEWRTASSGNHSRRGFDRPSTAALNEGVPRDLEIRIAGRDFSFVVTPIVENHYANLYGWDVTDRKRAEAALQESEERYRGLFESMNEGFALHELLYDESGEPCDYRFLDVNPAFERLTGLKRQDVVGKTVIEVLPGTEPDWIKRYGEVALTGTPAHFESRSSVLGRDYEVFAYRPAPGQFAVIFLDITDRMKAEEELRRAKNYSETLIRTANVLILGLDDAGNVQTFNDAAETITGYSRAEMLGRNWFEVAVPKDRYPRVWDEFLRLKDSSFPSEFENPIRTKKGGERVISWRNSEIRKGERVRGTISFGIDITDRRRAEAALRRNEARFRLLSGTAGRLLATDDPQGLIYELCRDVMEHLDCQAFFNFMVDESQGRLHLNACAGIPEGEIRKLEWLDYGVAVCGCVARDQTRIIAEDIFHTPDARTELVKSYGIRAYCCHPLKARERLIGTLSFGTKTRDHFTPEEVELMRIVADQVAIAMQRIRDRKSLQEALDAAEEGRRMLEVIMENVPEGITIADGPDMRIRMVSRHGRELLGGRHDGLIIPEVAGRWKVYQADGATPMADEDLPLASAIRSGDIVRDAELVQVNARGDRLSLLCNAAPIKDGDGRILGGVVAWRDITERVEAEHALRRSEARYRSYIEVTGQMGWTTNADGEVVDDAPGFRGYTGQTFDEIRGRGWSKALHPDDVEITRAVWQKAIEEKQGYETEFRIRRHDGVYRHFLARGTPILQ